MKLSDLKPVPVVFKSCGLELTFRPFTIADDLKTRDICGGKKETLEAFQNFDFEKISLVAWYQLTLESQREVLKAMEGFFIDPETGEEVNAKLKPIDKFRHLFIGVKDQIELLTNLIKCKGLNIPDLDDNEALKKWVDQFDLAMLTGQ